MSSQLPTVHVVGGGLAGSECALQLADFGFSVVLWEQRRGAVSTPAHKTDKLSELVCSNSFGSLLPTSAPGQLKYEAELMNSHILAAARHASVPAGNALGIDRDLFADTITTKVLNHPRIQLRAEEVKNLAQIPRPAVIATGPLTNESLANDLNAHFGGGFLYFFDAIAPIIDADSIDTEIAWKANRYGEGDGDYFNCPLSRQQYYDFIEAVKLARKIEPKEFEKDTPFFEGCMPIEEMISRGDKTLSFGPMKPVGLPDPRTGKIPFAVVQLRQDNQAGTAYNMVGFQTKMAYPEQTRIFKMIPGLENAEFLKLGSIHRNLYVNSPKVLNEDLSSRQDRGLFLAGQITGVEGYFDSTCTGLMVAQFLKQRYEDRPFTPPPRESAMGSLLYAITKEEKPNFQPTNINFSLFPVPSGLPEKRVPKDQKRALILQMARTAFEEYVAKLN